MNGAETLTVDFGREIDTSDSLKTNKSYTMIATFSLYENVINTEEKVTTGSATKESPGNVGKQVDGLGISSSNLMEEDQPLTPDVEEVSSGDGFLGKILPDDSTIKTVGLSLSVVVDNTLFKENSTALTVVNPSPVQLRIDQESNQISQNVGEGARTARLCNSYGTGTATIMILLSKNLQCEILHYPARADFLSWNSPWRISLKRRSTMQTSSSTGKFFWPDTQTGSSVLAEVLAIHS
ncbi:hypothetical protein DAPPUDRAFT_107741 [Daphnia pulex]|uniref:Uncharacterized protein n=1 Tax=Daphnia pulex TaxID=6669 RepID=E9GY30_DAPPU|nr:hypothetical protein DAPPUDRAFT_107741 [Daphnia pulex]|eukprot:EFX75632.1 hypothetical protein DAPPUDRAFT_107741 [Daphnia pulex]